LIEPSTRTRFQTLFDRLQTVDDEIQEIRDQPESAPTAKPERESPLGAESPEVIEAAAAVGERRLQRLNHAHAITALMGAFGVSFGAVAMSWVAGPWVSSLGYERAQLIGALAFPIGFVILLVGKGELFTENFFVPVTGVMRGRGTIRDLLELWGYVLFFNLVGSVIAAFLMSRSGVFDSQSAAFLKEVALNKVNYPFWDAFMKAIFAGWLMTIMTWLILAADSLGPRIVIIWMTGFLIVAAHFNHVVISAPEIFTAMWLGAPISVGDWFVGNFVPALIGNLIGGVVFVTILSFAQAHSLDQGDEQRANNGETRKPER
jgi:formate/nitrite transporter FocA (FNT family)